MKNIKYLLILLIIILSYMSAAGIDNQSVIDETLIRINQVRDLPQLLDYNSSLTKSYGIYIQNESANICYIVRVNETGIPYIEAC